MVVEKCQIRLNTTLTIIGVTRVKNMAALELYSLRMDHRVCGVLVTGARVSPTLLRVFRVHFALGIRLG